MLLVIRAMYGVHPPRNRCTQYDGTYLFRCDSRQAVSCYERAVRIAPDFKEGWTNMAQAFKELGQGLQAEQFFNKVRSIARHAPVHQTLIGIDTID
jgi:Tfp pilus assembly protein PilF